MNDFTVGPKYSAHGVQWCIWAPDLDHCALEYTDTRAGGAAHTVAMERNDRGFFTASISEAPEEIVYHIKRSDGQCIPDPYAPENIGGVHGRSLIRRPPAYSTRDSRWNGVLIEDAVIAEIHIGTYTPEGTLKACREKIAYLAETGFTALQLMPIWLTPGTRNWGYDSVSFFTLNPHYGTLADLRDLIDTAHAHGIAVIMDAVYNHLGPEGAYMSDIARSALSQTRTTPWGAQIGLDGPDGDTVAAIILQSVRYWMADIGFDGMRIDSAEYLCTDDDHGFLMEIARTAREACQHKNPLLILEYDHAKLSAPARETLLSVRGFSALWNISLETLEDDERDGGVPLTQSLKVLAGEASALSVIRGRENDFINFLRSHDTVGNSARTARNHSADIDQLLTAMAVLLLSPPTPMIFMGDEWLSDTPFHFFCDLTEIDEQDLITARAVGAPHADGHDGAAPGSPSPMSAEAFEQSKLDWESARSAQSIDTLTAIRAIIGLRKHIVSRFFGDGFFLEQRTASDDAAELIWRSRMGARLFIRIGHTLPEINSTSGEREIFASTTSTASSFQLRISMINPTSATNDPASLQSAITGTRTTDAQNPANMRVA